MARSRFLLLVMVSVLAGVWMAGCRSSVLPPTASVPAPQRPFTPYNGPYVPRSAAKVAAPETALWKPASTPRSWKYIVIHHTATSSGSVESIHEAHLKNKDGSGNPWLGIGYHFVIGNGQGMTDGAIEPTFRWREQMHGAHAGGANKEYNQVGIGVCLVGNFEETPPTPAQRRAVKQLVDFLRSEYQITSSSVVAHRDIRSTECPGKLFPMAEVAGDEPFPYTQHSDRPLPTKLAEVPGRVLR